MLLKSTTRGSVATEEWSVEVKVEKRNDADCRGALARGVSKCDRGLELVGGGASRQALQGWAGGELELPSSITADCDRKLCRARRQRRTVRYALFFASNGVEE